MPHPAIGRALVLAAAFAAAGVGAQTMYKWVDEKGTTHFSEHPPADAKTEKKASKVTPKVTPSSSGTYDPNAWKGKEAEAKKRSVERGQQAQSDAKDASKRAELCDRAKSRVAFLQNSGAIFRDNPDGSRVFMEDKQRDAEIARAREVANEACR